jgi:hypothetical protein
MKLKFILSIALLGLMACGKKAETNTTVAADSTELEAKYSRILFEELTYEFGKIKQGDIVKHTFNFKNDSDEPLVVSNAAASCGCTVPEWPKEPVKPGESGKIEVQFNSKGKSGVQNKTIIITANTLPNTTTIVLKGEIEAPPIPENKTK